MPNQESSISPSVVGQKLKEVTKEDFQNTSPYVLVIRNLAESGVQELFIMNKEEFYEGAFLDKDITQEIFNSPLYDTSYQDLIPGNWVGLPDMSLIGLDQPNEWLVQYFRNPNINEVTGGTQILKCMNGIEFIRTGINKKWTQWQIISSNPYGLITAGLFKDRLTNNCGWLPLNGVSYAKSKYPQLWKVLEGKVTSDTLTFTLPNLNDKYISTTNNDGKIAKFDTWKLPDITDRVGLLAGSESLISLFRDSSKRSGKLFQIEREDDTTPPYLNSNVVVNPVTGDPVVGDGSGLTNYLKLDLKEAVGETHVGVNILKPDTFYVSNFYIYGGYPQE